MSGKFISSLFSVYEELFLWDEQNNIPVLSFPFTEETEGEKREKKSNHY